MYRSVKYQAWVRGLNKCIRCDYEPTRPGLEDDNPITFAHQTLGQAGTALKAPDTQGLPLCAQCHQIEHTMPPSEFWDGIDVKMEIIKQLTRYMEEKRL